MSFTDKNQEKDDFWDLDKLVPKKKIARLSPFVTKPTVSDYTVSVGRVDSDEQNQNEKRAEERKLTQIASATVSCEDTETYYPENSLIKSITIKKLLLLISHC